MTVYVCGPELESILCGICDALMSGRDHGSVRLEIRGTNQDRESMTTSENWNNTLQYTEDGVRKAVFYSYPNDWFDVSKLNDNGTFIDDDIYAKDDLIDENKQTYILLTYEGNEFKVPVNFSIADYNDKPSFTADEIKELRNDYYRMQRNYIYNVTVTVDIDTKKVVTWEILVVPWNEIDIEVPPFT